MPLRRPSGPPTLRHTWTGIVVVLISIILGLGAVSLVSTQYQRVMFDRTTSDLQQKTGAVDNLERALLDLNQTLVAVLYSPTAEARAEGLRVYRVTQAEMNAAFTLAEGEMAGTAMAPSFVAARAHWRALDAAVESAEDKWADGTAMAAFAKGEDVYGVSVWGRVVSLIAALTELGAESVAVLGVQVAAVHRVQLLIGPLVVSVVAFALAMGWLLGRRMQSRVLGPLIQLQAAAAAMRKADLDRIVEVPGASAELQDLATTLNETSIALRASHRLLHDEANTDVLSGLANRRAFVQELHTMLDQDDSGPVGVLFVDLDDFKVVNDSLGHAAGDELLRIVGQRLLASTRQGELVARLGGDEFAIAVPGMANALTLVQVAERTLSVIQNPVTIDDTLVSVRCSIGVARSEAGDDRTAADELLRNADFAMYMAKGQGKSCYEVFAPSMHNDMLSRMELKRDLAQAVPLDQFQLLYQPVLDLETQRVMGFEALIRWQHPERGLLNPVDFISLAEDTGDIAGIGEWVIEEACATLATMRRNDAGTADPTESKPWMSVNISARQLVGVGLPATVGAAIARHGLTAGDLVVEITEGVALTNTREAVETLAALRGLGVQIALDDFGTGYSSLRWLSELPVDVIKIDRSFVMKAGADNDSMLESIVALGQRLGLQVIAEGIELPWELDRLRQLGAKVGQGFLFARPMPAAQAIEFGVVDAEPQRL